MDLEYGPSPGLIFPSPPHGLDTRGCHHCHLNEKTQTTGQHSPDAPLSSELWPCTAYPDIARKPLGLNP